MAIALASTTEPAAAVHAHAGGTRARRGRALAVALGLPALGLSAWATVEIAGAGWATGDHPAGDLLATWLQFGALVALPIVGLALAWARPWNASGRVMLALAAVWALWSGAGALGSTTGAYLGNVGAFMRPLLFLLVLAWPIGRLGRAERIALGTYTAVEVLLWWGQFLVHPYLPSDSIFPHRNALLIVDAPDLASALQGILTSVVMPIGAIVVVAAALRRFRRLPGPARRLGAFALAAALLAALGDLVLTLLDTYLGSVLEDDAGRTALGGVVAVFDIGRFLWVPLVLGAGAWTARVSAGPRVRTIEVGEGAARLGLQDRVAAALHDDTVRVAFPAPGAGWVGTDGSPAELGARGRSVTVVERDGEPVAAVEHAAALDDRPVVVEAAVAAAAATIEFERLEALARSRYIDAQEARHAIVDVEDTVRRRIERDLHDGAQQRLVGLALQASLAAVAAGRDGSDDGTTAAALVLGIDEARADLHHLVAGLAPAVLAERGLASALTTLAATTPMAVDVRVALPTDLPAAAATLAWFVVAESVANTVKHARASRLEIEGAVADGALSVCVRDDGCGGADDTAGTGLRNLRRRVTDAGGVLRIDSPVGGGTTVRVELAAATSGGTR